MTFPLNIFIVSKAHAPFDMVIASDSMCLVSSNISTVRFASEV